MSGADDWTIDIERRGLPELKALYKLLGAEDRVMAKCFPEFKHNYNQVARELMYNWFNKHLHLGQPSPVREKPFEPIPPKELSVYDGRHPRPADAVGAAGLRKYLTATAEAQLAALKPADARSLAESRRVLGTALRVLAHDRLPGKDEVEVDEVGDKEKRDGVTWRRFLLGRKGQGERVPAVGLRGDAFDGTVVVWVHPAGKSSLLEGGKLVPAARKLLDAKAAILAVDAFGTGELTGENVSAVDPRFAGYTFGYNRPLLAQRVHDVLTALAFARGHDKAKAVHLVGFGKAGPWALLARGLCGDAAARTAADADRFRFDRVRSAADEMMLPGALKYGGLPALAALAAPGELFVHNHGGTGVGGWLKAAYRSAGAADKLRHSGDKADPGKVAAWLVR
jgi:hypothetical protein